MRHVSNMLRLLQIGIVLARYDALFLLRVANIAPVLRTFLYFIPRLPSSERPGLRLVRALHALGPAFIKFGQALSTRPDVVGDATAADLAALQDHVPPYPVDKAIAQIEESLGVSLGSVFASFDREPVAAASIAQVHFATTTEGAQVAVKVLRPGIAERMMKDIALFYWLAEVATRAMPALARLKLVEVVATFETSVKMELDLRFEAAACAELKENMAAQEGFYVPAVDWKRTSLSVMTMERISGVRIDDAEGLLKAGHDTTQLMAYSAGALFMQVFRDGFFHADLHPGNVFVDAAGRLAVLDFGIMGRLDEKTRMYLAEMLLAFLNRDYRTVAEVHIRAGYVPAHHSVEHFAQACRSIAEPIFGLPQGEISIGRLLQQLFKITADFEMETQPQLLLLQKTMMMAEGMCRILNPNINMWKLAEPLMQDWARQNMSPVAQAKRHAREAYRLANHVKQLLESSSDLSHCITPAGLRLHPETILGLQKRQEKTAKPLIYIGLGCSVMLILLWLTNHLY